MQRAIVILLGAGWAMAFLILGLWAWQRGPAVAEYFSAAKPSTATWACRAAAVSLVGLGEALFTILVVGTIWRRDRLTDAVGLLSSIAFVAGGITAVVLGVRAR